MEARKYTPPADVPLIDGVRIKILRPIPDDRGRLMEILRRDDDLFLDFQQAYLTTAWPGVVKAWHRHARQWDNLAVIQGMARIALFDDREGSSTRGRLNEFHAGVYRPMLVRVPPGVWHGFRALGDHEVLLLNFPTELYRPDDPDEYRIPPDDPSIPYDWGLREG